MRSNNEVKDKIDITGGSLGVAVRPATVVWIAASPRSLACGRVVAVSGPWVGEDASISLGAVVADAGRPLR